jgi:hypothetical protein
LTERAIKDGVYLAHFQGNTVVALQWALAIHDFLERQSRSFGGFVPMDRGQTLRNSKN